MKWLWSMSRYFPSILKGLMKTTKNVTEDGRLYGDNRARDLSHTMQEY